jgi:hypothetical protein
VNVSVKKNLFTKQMHNGHSYRKRALSSREPLDGQESKKKKRENNISGYYQNVHKYPSKGTPMLQQRYLRYSSVTHIFCQTRTFTKPILNKILERVRARFFLCNLVFGTRCISSSQPVTVHCSTMGLLYIRGCIYLVGIFTINK